MKNLYFEEFIFLVQPPPNEIKNKMSCASSSLLESLLNDSSQLNLSQIKKIYVSLEEYQINLCLINEENTSLSRAFSAIGTT